MFVFKRIFSGLHECRGELPAALVWLIRSTHDALLSANVERQQVALFFVKVLQQNISFPSKARLVCIDLLFTCFICVGIASPDSLGLVGDTPITAIARFNLIQIGQVIQTLALAPYENIDDRAQDVYSQFQPVASSLNFLLTIRTFCRPVWTLSWPLSLMDLPSHWNNCT